MLQGLWFHVPLTSPTHFHGKGGTPPGPSFCAPGTRRLMFSALRPQNKSLVPGRAFLALGAGPAPAREGSFPSFLSRAAPRCSQIQHFHNKISKVFPPPLPRPLPCCHSRPELSTQPSAQLSKKCWVGCEACVHPSALARQRRAAHRPSTTLRNTVVRTGSDPELCAPPPKQHLSQRLLSPPQHWRAPPGHPATCSAQDEWFMGYWLGVF